MQPEQDLAGGRLLQRSLLPQQIPSYTGLDIAAEVWTAVDLGGDYYQFLEQPGLLGIAIADSSGKSVAGAIHAALFKGQLDAYAQQGKLRNPLVVLDSLNQLLCQTNTSGDAIALCYGVLDLGTYQLNLGGAGVPGPIIYHAANQTCEEVVNPGMALGRFASAPFRSSQRQLHEGDVVIFFSDGLTEATNASGLEFGEKNIHGISALEHVLKAIAHLSADQILQRLRAALKQFSQRDIPEDDVSIVVLKLNQKVTFQGESDCPYQEALQAWLRSDEQDSSALLRGNRLVEALEWAASRTLSRSDQAFLEASQRIQEKEKMQAKLLEEAQKRAATAERLEKLTQQLEKSLEAERHSRLMAEMGELNERIVALTISSEALYFSNNHIEALIAGLIAGAQLRRLFSQIDNSTNMLKPNTQMRTITALEQVVYGINEYNRLEGHGYWVNKVRFSKDGKYIASASSDRTIKVWQSNGLLLQTLQGHGNAVTSVAFSPNGKLLVSCSRDNMLRLWRWDDQLGKFGDQPVQMLKGHDGPVLDVCFSPDGELIASASEDTTVKLWKLNGTNVKTMRGGHERWVTCVAFHPNGKTLVSGSADRTLIIWTLNGNVSRTLKGHESFVEGVDFDPAGNALVSCGRDRTVRLWGIDGMLLRTFQGHSDRVWGVAFAPDGTMIASASSDRTIKLWDLEGRMIKSLNSHGDVVNSVAFNPDSKSLVSGSRDTTVKLWSPQGNPLLKIAGHSDEVYCVAVSPDLKLIASAGKEKVILVRSIAGQVIARLEGHLERVNRLCFSPDGSTIVSVSGDSSVKLWSRDGQLITSLGSHRSEVHSVVYRPDGQIFATSSADSTIRVWLADGTWLQTLSGHTGDVYAIAYSPDGSLLVSVGKDKVICLWNWEGKLLRSFEGHSAEIFAVCFRPDGNQFATAGMDQSIKFWDLEGNLIKTLNGHSAEIRAICYSPDGKALASASDDTTIQFWGLDGTLLRTFNGHQAAVRDLFFHPEGKYIISASLDHHLILWNLDMENLLVRGCKWLQEYLKTNVNVSEEDRRTCIAGCGWLFKQIQQKNIKVAEPRPPIPIPSPPEDEDMTQIQIR
ncbi:MAG: SpoIIE family protein phosphatase [Pseudanabaenaceae cyanobacterium bins.68]|nr:SpoIIE family protein phosphatase [Pseudanabaenaceae cyanobacterium bins.68]